jgi:hypothetical protein
MTNIICVLYDDPVSGYPPSYGRDSVPTNRLVEVLDVREQVRDKQREVGREASFERQPQGW